MKGDAVVELRGVGRRFGGVVALEGIDLVIRRGERVGLTGASGSGKSTLARILTLHEDGDAGERRVGGERCERGGAEVWREARRRLQLVFQDPGTSFVHQWTLKEILQEALRGEEAGRAAELLERVQLPQRYLGRKAGELSGGERRRLAVARALGARPDLLVLDESLSGLDGPLRNEMAELLVQLARQDGFAMVTVTHDWRLLGRVAERGIVLAGGRVVEEGPVEEVVERPQSAAGRALRAGAYWGEAAW